MEAVASVARTHVSMRYLIVGVAMTAGGMIIEPNAKSNLMQIDREERRKRQ